MDLFGNSLEAPQVKTCPECGESKPADGFYRTGYKTSVQRICKACTIKSRQVLRNKRRTITRSLPTKKRCSECGETKPGIKGFGTDAGSPDGLNWRCKSCHNKRIRARYAKGKLNPPPPPIEKTCPGCGETKRGDAFYRAPANSDGRTTLCGSCHSKLKKKKKYGITHEEYERVLSEQGGKCPGCGRNPTDVDHNHKTGEFRGVLCNPCNMGIGLLGDDPARLRRLAEYLDLKGNYARAA